MYEKEGNKHPESLIEALQLDNAPVPTREKVLDKIAYHKVCVEYYEQLLKEIEEGES